MYWKYCEFKHILNDHETVITYSLPLMQTISKQRKTSQENIVKWIHRQEGIINIGINKEQPIRERLRFNLL